MTFLDPEDFEALKPQDLADRNVLVAIRKDSDEKKMQVGKDWKDAILTTFLAVDGDRAGTVEYDKPITNTALRRLLNDNRVSIGDVFVGRLVNKDTSSGKQAVVLDGCSADERKQARDLWLNKVKDDAPSDDDAPPDDDFEPPPDNDDPVF